MTEPPQGPSEGSANDASFPPPSGQYEPPASEYQPPAGSYPPPGGSFPPPAGGFPPPSGGFPPPGPYPPAGAPGGSQFGSTADDRTWILVAHFGAAAACLLTTGLLGFVPPLVAYLAKGQQSPTVRSHAVAATNFHILCAIVAFFGWLTACLLIGWVFMVAAMGVGTVFSIIAGIKANEGQPYRYPFNVPFMK